MNNSGSSSVWECMTGRTLGRRTRKRSRCLGDKLAVRDTNKADQTAQEIQNIAPTVSPRVQKLGLTISTPKHRSEKQRKKYGTALSINRR